MTAHAPAHFTPAQVLAAGQRAEAEGRTDFALRLYRHLITHHSDLAEAAAAHAGVARLTGQMPPPHPHDLHHRPAAQPAPAPNSQSAAWPPTHSHRPISIAPLDRSEEAAPFVPPAPVRDYRAGRILAKTMTWLGGIGLVAGLAVAGVAAAAPGLLSALPAGSRWPGGAVLAAGLMGSGAVLMLLGQLARALLEQANAVRDLALLSRARAEHDAVAGGSPRKPRY